jgi:hypothetical protein
MNQQELAALHRRAETELMKYPGVVGVGYGFKETQGGVTDRLAFRVYVKEKKPESQLGPGEAVPPSYEGFPTDVLIAEKVKKLHCEDISTHDPLISGISVSNLKQAADGSVGAGTLGFFAHMNGVSGPKNVVLVSNAHVLLANGAQKGDTIHQNKMVETGGVVTGVDLTTNAVAKIENVGLEGNMPFSYPGEAASQFFVDCTSARLKISISSCCHTNCGTSYKNEVRGLNLDRTADGKGSAYSKIDNVNRVAQSNLVPGTPYVVYKVGRRTSKTKGKVVEVAKTTDGGGKNVIVIHATEPNCNGELRFADVGDSGSALVNEKNELVGLLFAVSQSDMKTAFACHIAPVLHKLDIKPITVANPPVPPAGQAVAQMAAVIEEGVDHGAALRRKFYASARGAEIAELVERHVDEVIHLVNHCRPVTIAWHRHQGPAFLAHLLENARDPSHAVPAEIEGVSRETLMRNIADALFAHGSAELRAAMAPYRELALAIAARLHSLHEVVEEIDALETPV